MKNHIIIFIIFALFYLNTRNGVNAVATVTWPSTQIYVPIVSDGAVITISGEDWGTGPFKWQIGSQVGDCENVYGCWSGGGVCTVRLMMKHLQYDEPISTARTIKLMGIIGGNQTSPTAVVNWRWPYIANKGILDFTFALSGQPLTMTGLYFTKVAENGCLSSYTDPYAFYVLYFKFLDPENIIYPDSCSTTQAIFNIPVWGYSPSGLLDAIWSTTLYDTPFDSWKVEYVYPAITSVSRSSLPLSGARVTIYGDNLGYTKSWYGYLVITNTGHPVWSSSWVSMNDNQIVVDFPSECYPNGLQNINLSWGTTSYTWLSNCIQYNYPSITASSYTISHSSGGTMRLTGSNLGTSCSFYTYADAGGVSSTTRTGCSDTYIDFTMPSGGTGTNVAAHLAWCSGPYTTCAGCVTFV